MPDQARDFGNLSAVSIECGLDFLYAKICRLKPLDRPLSRNSERQYFLWVAVFALTLVIVGFARTYFLHRFFKTPDLSLFIHTHAVIMMGWIVLFVIQTLFVRWRRMDWHRTLGYVGAGYAVLVVTMGSSATFIAARREVRAASAEQGAFLTVLCLELTQMAMFACLVALSVYSKHRPAYHKRFMILATLCMLPNPIVRLLILLGVTENLTMLTVWAVFVAIIVAIDVVKRGEVHPAFAFGGSAIIGLLYSAYFVSITPLWQALATRAVR